MLDRAKQGKATAQQLFDYYLGFLTDPSITDHFQFIPDADGRRSPAAGGCASRSRTCGGSCEPARKRGGKVVRRRPLARRLDHDRLRDLGLRRQAGRRRASTGLVFIDGGSGPTPITADEATHRCSRPRRPGSPWLTFGGIPAPFAGPVQHRRRRAAHLAIRTRPRSVRAWPLLPAQPEAAGPGDQPGAVRLRARHRDLAASLAPRRHTSATWPPAATRAAGTTRARSRRCSASPRCSRARA